MINGRVNPDLEAVIGLWLRGPQGEIEIDVVLDTGFSGCLSLPLEIIEELGLELKSEGVGELADGSRKSFGLYEALVFWNGRLSRIPVGALDSAPLLGMTLLQGSELAIQVIAGGEVMIQEIRAS